MYKYELIVLLIIYLGVPLCGTDDQIQIVQFGRENSLDTMDQSNGPGYLFHIARYRSHIEAPDYFSFTMSENNTDSILQYLIQAEINLKGPKREVSNAYNQYLKALDFSAKVGNKVLQCESLKRLMNYYVFDDKDEAAFHYYHRLHKESAYDKIEELYSQYFELRAQVQYAIDINEEVVIKAETWSNLLEDCSSEDYFRLETLIRSLYAVYLEFHEKNYHKARDVYESLIYTSQKVDNETAERMRFTALANIGAMYFEIGNYIGAIDYLRRASKIDLQRQKPKNLIYIYNWLSDTYTRLEQHDSAYYYLRKAYDTNQEYEFSKNQIEVKDIEEKYQNELLKVNLMTKELETNRNFLLASIFGALFVIGTIVYANFARISRLKKQNLEHNLSALEKESQLKAINAKVDGEEEERKRVAHVLHDNIATHLAASRLHLKALREDDQSREAYLDKTDLLLKEVSTTVRKLSHELYPPTLYKLGLSEALDHLCEQYSNDQIQFEYSTSSDLFDFPKEKGLKLFFIIQEILNNVIKHSQATNCKINCSSDQNTLIVSVIDDGIGIDTTSSDDQNSLGLHSVKARVRSMNGSFDLKSAEGNGTEIILGIPII